jgi:hypothetical protein
MLSLTPMLFLLDRQNLLRACGPTFSSHVRWGEHGAPVVLLRDLLGLRVQEPQRPFFPGSVWDLVSGLVDELEAYRHEPEGQGKA